MSATYDIENRMVTVVSSTFTENYVYGPVPKEKTCFSLMTDSERFWSFSGFCWESLRQLVRQKYFGCWVGSGPFQAEWFSFLEWQGSSMRLVVLASSECVTVRG